MARGQGWREQVRSRNLVESKPWIFVRVVRGVGGVEAVVAKYDSPQDSSGCRMETGLEEMRVGQVICMTSL